MPFRMGPTERIILLVIIMIFFGVGKLPQAGRSVDKAIREFRSAQDDVNEAVEPGTSSKQEGTKREANADS